MTIQDAGHATMTNASVVRLFDCQLIKDTITNPKVYPYVSDDFSPCAEDYQPQIHDAILYLGVFHDEEYRGLFMLHPINGVTYEIHTCLLPNARGRARDYVNMVFKWFWDNTSAVRLVTQIPEYNRLANKLAHDVGMVEYGLNPKSYQHDGELHDIHMMGISRGSVCQ